MRLLEYESKQLFANYAIPLPPSKMITSVNEIAQAWEELGEEAVVIKAQLPIGGRGKAGLIKVAKTLDEAQQIGQELFEKRNLFSKYDIDKLLIEKAANIKTELYVSITLDPSERKYVAIASPSGGVDIEQVARETPDLVKKFYFDLPNGLTEDLGAEIALSLDLPPKETEQAASIFCSLWKAMWEEDAQLVEINPLVYTGDALLAVDGKVILDDNAEFRSDLVKKLKPFKFTELELKAGDAGFSYVQLDGDIGILANGAGLTMALIDLLSEKGLKSANFLDVGGGASETVVFKALDVLVTLAPRAILINIYGGITRCDEVAKAVVSAQESFKNLPPLVIRLSGTKEKEGRTILQEAGLRAFETMQEAVDALSTL
ncbi:MAG: ADP-forming succinate--CoA ligase subunit beta [Candidatus Hodarchaeota archaeon]